MPIDKESKIIREKISPGFERQIAHLDNLMVVICDYSDGPMKEPEQPHSHPHEQITYIAEGELLFFRGGLKYNLSKGDIITIPPGVLHCIQTVSGNARLVDSFTPLRKDFITKG